MARQLFDTFLPSGILEQSRSPELRHHSEPMVSPRTLVPRGGAATYIPHHFQGSSHKSNNNYMSPLSSPPPTQTSPSDTPRHNQNGHLISPPISRSGSSDDKAAGLTEDWRVFTRRLREQFLGEKAHMEADRACAEAVMAEERALWDKERGCYQRRIAELEAQLASFTSSPSQRSTLSTTTLPASYFPPIPPAAIPSAVHQSTSNGPKAKTPNSNNLDSTSAKAIRQESGRNPDGSPFYAPAPQNPSRTFESLSTSELGIDSMCAPHETPLRVTSKKLTQSDFLQAPNWGSSTEGSVVGDSIDISFIQPELEGVPIRSSAVSSTFAAQVRSPSGAITSPGKFSPDVRPPQRPIQSYDRQSPTSGPKKTLEIIKQPEGRRLTMHAGHTPNHSVIHFELGDSGLTTPKASVCDSASVCESESEAFVEQFEILTEDPELKGPLGLTNEAPEDERFLAALTSKLEEVAENAVSASETSEESAGGREMSDTQMLQMALLAIGRGNTSHGCDEGNGRTPEAPTDDIPVLKLKPSTNFGRPLGSL